MWAVSSTRGTWSPGMLGARTGCAALGRRQDGAVVWWGTGAAVRASARRIIRPGHLMAVLTVLVAAVVLTGLRAYDDGWLSAPAVAVAATIPVLWLRWRRRCGSAVAVAVVTVGGLAQARGNVQDALLSHPRLVAAMGSIAVPAGSSTPATTPSAGASCWGVQALHPPLGRVGEGGGGGIHSRRGPRVAGLCHEPVGLRNHARRAHGRRSA